VCLTQIQVIDYDSFFWLQRILPHIKIRVTEGVSALALDLIIGSGPQGADGGAWIAILD